MTEKKATKRAVMEISPRRISFAANQKLSLLEYAYTQRQIMPAQAGKMSEYCQQHSRVAHNHELKREQRSSWVMMAHVPIDTENHEKGCAISKAGGDGLFDTALVGTIELLVVSPRLLFLPAKGGNGFDQ